MAGLFNAIRSEDCKKVTEILSKPGNSRLVNNPADYQETPLHLAAEIGNISICKALLAAGARCDIPNAQKHTPLHRAALKGYDKVIKLLLSTGNGRAVVDRVDARGCTALHFAADRSGNYESVKLLCEYDANILVRNSDGLTPCQVAQRADKTDIHYFLKKRLARQRNRPYGEMNWYEEQIIEAYKHIMEAEQWPDPRVRIATIGDRGSGKTSVGRVMFNSTFNPREEPTHVAAIGSSMAHIRLRPRNEWRLSKSSSDYAQSMRTSFEDYITVKIFEFMRKRWRAQKENGTMEYTPTSTQSTADIEGRPSATHLPTREGIHWDYLVVEIPAPPQRRASVDTVSLDSGNNPEAPEYIAYDMSATFSERLRSTVPPSQLENIFKWWTRRNNLRELPSTVPGGLANPLYTKPPAQASDCYLAWSEFCGEPTLVCLLPLVFSSRWVYLLTYNLQTSLDRPVDSWQQSRITTCDGDVLKNGEVLVEWLSSATATAGVRDNLHTPVTLPSCYCHAPVMLLVGTHYSNSTRDAPVQVCREVKKLAPSAELHFNPLNPKLPNRYPVIAEVDCSQNNSQSLGLLRRELEQACRNMCTFAQNIPLIWSNIYLHLLELQKENKKTWISVSQLHHQLQHEAQIFVTSAGLQVALRYFHSLGSVCYFHQQPQLKEILFLQPERVLAALSSVLIRKKNWNLEKHQADYHECLRSGIFKRNLLFLIYDSGQHPLDFKLCLYMLDSLNVLCLHPTLNSNPQRPCYIIPCLVQETYPDGFFPNQALDGEAEWLMFESQGTPFPWAVYNQLITCCCRAFVTYLPKIWQGMAHFQLTNHLHLMVVHGVNCVSFRVERNESACRYCILRSDASDRQSGVCFYCRRSVQSVSSEQGICNSCSRSISFFASYPAELSRLDDSSVCYVDWEPSLLRLGMLSKDQQTAVIARMKKPGNSPALCLRSVVVPVKIDSLAAVLPVVREYLCQQLACITDCWFPGLAYSLKTKHWEGRVKVDQKWWSKVNRDTLPPTLQCWWH